MFPENQLVTKNLSHTFYNQNSKVSLVNLQIKSHNKPLRETPLCTPFCSASLTVEAAFIVPIFLMFFVSILSIFRIFYVQVSLEKALCSTAEIFCMQGYLTEEFSAEDTEVIQDENEVTDHGIDVVSIGEATVLVRSKLDEYAIENLQGKSAGLICTYSEDGQNISLTALCQITLPISYFGKRTFTLEKEVIGRKWTGYQYDSESTDNEIVYITPTGEVYHRDKNCSYLKTKLTKISKNELSSARNKDGGKYYPCECCAKGQTEQEFFYIAEYGDRYHTSVNCPAMERTIIAISIGEIGDRRPCSKCGGIQ